MSIEALRALISAPPYDTMTDEECAAALNVPTVVVQGDVSKSQYILWLAANDGFAIIDRAQAFASPSPEIQAGVRAAGMAAGAILTASDVPAINTGDAQVLQLFGLFQQVGLLSAGAVESFMAYGRIMKTPADAAGLGSPSFADVLEARRGR